jgi:hypothetical protein
MKKIRGLWGAFFLAILLPAQVLATQTSTCWLWCYYDGGAYPPTPYTLPDVSVSACCQGLALSCPGEPVESTLAWGDPAGECPFSV